MEKIPDVFRQWIVEIIPDNKLSFCRTESEFVLADLFAHATCSRSRERWVLASWTWTSILPSNDQVKITPCSSAPSPPGSARCSPTAPQSATAGCTWQRDLCATRIRS